MDIQQLTDWFMKEKRNFPWRDHPSPYRVWISEIMLQQTRAEVVTDYFFQWVRRFPDIFTLASATEEEVLKAWEGLGYYSRARNIHRTARYLTRHCKGIFPSNRALLEKLPGIGPYTAGAILSFAFHQKSAAIDGNVRRVLARLFFLPSPRLRELEDRLLKLLPSDMPHIPMEALIELGALVCKKRPLCSACPIRANCQTYAATPYPETIPLSKPSSSIATLYRQIFCITDGHHVLLHKIPKGKVMADLWEFPYRDVDETIYKKQEFPSNLFLQPVDLLDILPITRHSFTRYHVHLSSAVFFSTSLFPFPEGKWVELSSVFLLPFSSGHKKVLSHFFSCLKEKKSEKCGYAKSLYSH